MRGREIDEIKLEIKWTEIYLCSNYIIVSRRRILLWLRAKHKRAQKIKHLVFIQYKSSPSAYPFKVYCKESNKLSKLMKKSRRKYEQQLTLKAKAQPKLLFAHGRRKWHKNIIGLKDNEG